MKLLFSFILQMLSFADFLILKPILLHGFTGFLHLVLLATFFVLWVCKKIIVSTRDYSEEKLNNSLHKKTLFCSLGVSGFNLILCLFNYFYFNKNGWSEEQIVTLLDLAFRTIAWAAICVYLHARFISYGERRFPLFFRIWCGFYFIFSSYCLIVDIILYEQQVSLPVQYLISDVVSVFAGLFFCYVGIFVKNEGEEKILVEPLLNDNPNVSTKGSETVTPYSNAGIFSILTFSWMSPLIAIGNKKILDLDDVPKLASSDSVFGAFPILRNKLEADCGTISSVTTLKLVKLLIFSAWKDILLIAFLSTLYTLASYVGPYLIDTFVQYLNGKRKFKNEGYLLVSAFSATKVIECLSQRQWLFRFFQVGVRFRALLVTIIYNKCLTLSCQSKQGHTTGEVINIMAVDAERVGDFSWHMIDLWNVLLHLVFAFLILYENIGLASIAAFVATIILMLANVPLGKLQEKFQGKLMDSKDRRMKATSEILRNMRILKLEGWEMKFLSKITELRKSEEGWLKKYVYTSALTSFVFGVAPTFVSVVTFGTCMLIGIPLDLGNILSALATFGLLGGSIYNLPDTISMIIQTKVSLDRISSFLHLDAQSDVIEKLPRGSSDKAIEVIDGNFSWELSSSNMTLKIINLSVFHGMRVAVCGTVGSGKSSLLSCVLGEVPKVSGTLKVCGTKAYVASHLGYKVAK